jgi:hypothetical protein
MCEDRPDDPIRERDPIVDDYHRTCPRNGSAEHLLSTRLSMSLSTATTSVPALRATWKPRAPLV